MSSNGTHKVSITGDGPFKNCVVVDGVDLSKGLTGINLTIGVGEVPRLTIDVQLIDVTELKDVEAKVVLGAGAHDVLVALGWTPPTDRTKSDMAPDLR